MRASALSRSGAGGQPARSSPKALSRLEKIQAEFNAAQDGATRISLADLIVLAGGVGVEEAARKAGYSINVPFHPGRNDATAEQTDVGPSVPLEPKADGFRNYRGKSAEPARRFLLVDKANLLGLSAPQMAVLVAGLPRAGRQLRRIEGGRVHRRPGTLTNDFFTTITDMDVTWSSKGRRGGGLRRDRRRQEEVARHPRRPGLRLQCRAAHCRRSAVPTTPRASSSMTSSPPG